MLMSVGMPATLDSSWLLPAVKAAQFGKLDIGCYSDLGGVGRIKLVE